MCAEPQTYAKIAESTRTQLAAINAHANLDLQEKIAKQASYQSQMKYKLLITQFLSLVEISEAR